MGSSPSPPAPPNEAKSYAQGIQVYMQYLPQMLQAEESAREQYDPQRIAEQQGLQDKFGPKQYQQMLQGLNALDPQFLAARKQYSNAVTGDLSSGMKLTPDQQRVVEQDIRASQAARGNIYGGGATNAEAYALGDRGLALYQQRLGNVSNYLNMPTIAQQSSAVPPVSADRSMSYVNPNAGYLGQQFALQNYQNQLAATQLSAGSNPWSTVSSLIGAIGSVAGAVAISDRRAKTNIKPIGTLKGSKIYEFAYKHQPGVTHVGAMAQDVEKKNPDAVSIDARTGFKKVNYSKLGLPFLAAA